MSNENKAAIELAAQALWDHQPHQMLKAGGHPVDWSSQPSIIKNDYRRQAKKCVKAFLGATEDRLIPVPLPAFIDPELSESGQRYADGYNDAISEIKTDMIEIGMKY